MREGALTAREYCGGLLERIRAREPQVQAFAALDEERALAIAEARDRERIAGRPPAGLHGIPVGVKDIFDTDDLPTQMGSAIFAGHRPDRNAAAVDRLIASGAYVLGKTVTTELAFLHPGKTRNPWNPAHTPGGSSSGSAAAVAAGFVPVAIGTQTNGSVIRPAAFCGVVGFKPTFGLVPLAGCLPFSPTLDQAGVFARSAGDATMLAAALAEGSSIDAEVRAASRPPRIALLPHFPWNMPEPEAAAGFRTTVRKLSDAGAILGEMRLPPALEKANLVHRAIMFYEGAREHGARRRAKGDLLSGEIRAAIDEGCAISNDQYRTALASRASMTETALDLFADYDAIASLPAPGAAPQRLDITGDPSFCTLWSLTGFPSVTIPTGFSRDGLPLGLQLAAPAGADNALLGIASWCEAIIGFDRR